MLRSEQLLRKSISSSILKIFFILIKVYCATWQVLSKCRLQCVHTLKIIFLFRTEKHLANNTLALLFVQDSLSVEREVERDARPNVSY